MNWVVCYKKTFHQYVHTQSLIYHQHNVILATDRIVTKRVIFSASALLFERSFTSTKSKRTLNMRAKSF
jgi:hypothetical protein